MENPILNDTSTGPWYYPATHSWGIAALALISAAGVTVVIVIIVAISRYYKPLLASFASSVRKLRQSHTNRKAKRVRAKLAIRQPAHRRSRGRHCRQKKRIGRIPTH